MAREHFDAVIVGSGFGGSVTSYRLAEAGLDVCLLERGQAYSPGSFPRTPQMMKRNFWDPSEGLYGMFDLWSFDGIDPLISSAPVGSPESEERPLVWKTLQMSDRELNDLEKAVRERTRVVLDGMADEHFGGCLLRNAGKLLGRKKPAPSPTAS